MLYHLFVPLEQAFSGFRVFRYATFRAAFAALLAFLIATIVGPGVVRALAKAKVAGTALTGNESEDKRRLERAKIPTMGGVILLAGVGLSSLLLARLDAVVVWLAIGSFLAFGAQDRPGRVAISPRDFCRFGLLYLRRGRWNGERILTQERALTAVTRPLPLEVPRTAAVEDPTLRAEVQRFFNECYLPARTRFLQDVPSAAAAAALSTWGDADPDWVGSHAFQADPNLYPALYASAGVPGFALDVTGGDADMDANPVEYAEKFPPYYPLQYDPTGAPTWTALATPTAGTVIFPTAAKIQYPNLGETESAVSTTYGYVALTGDGSSLYTGARVPEWPHEPGAIVRDGTVLWQCFDNRIGLERIRVTVRFRDVGSGQSRQVTLIHSFVE